MRYVRFDERLQLDEDALFAMHSLAATALEETACHSRAASQRETIGDECVRDEDEIDLLARRRRMILPSQMRIVVTSRRLQ